MVTEHGKEEIAPQSGITSVGEEAIDPDFDAVKEMFKDLWYGISRGWLDSLGCTEVGGTAQRILRSPPDKNGHFQLRHSDELRFGSKFEDKVRRCMGWLSPERFGYSQRIRFKYGAGADAAGTEEALVRRGRYNREKRAEYGKPSQAPAKTIFGIMRCSDRLSDIPVRAAIARLMESR